MSTASSSNTKESNIEEEFLLYVDLENQLPDEKDEQEKLDVNIIGIDSEHPVVQINDRIFKGSFEFSMGTNVFFEIDDDNPDLSHLDPLFDIIPKNMYKIKGKSNKVLKLERIHIEEKQKDKTNESDSPDIQEKIRQNKMTYEEALHLFLPPGEKPPYKIIKFKEAQIEGQEEQLTMDTVLTLIDKVNSSDVGNSE